MKRLKSITLFFLLSCALQSTGQAPSTQERVVRMTGVRFSYPLVEHWIERYNKVNPDVQIIIEWRGSQDPSQYDILIEAYEQPDEIRKQREYINIARYAIILIANSHSDFSKIYSGKGLNTETIKQVFFHDIYADIDEDQKVSVPFTNYTRLQKAGAPLVFAQYFGYQQKDIVGKGIAGSDDHLLKAVLRDSTGVSYLPLSLVYERSSKKPVAGLSVIPVDLNGNGRLSDDEKFYDNLSNVIQHLDNVSSKGIHNVPIEYLHFSVDKNSASSEAISFIRWVIDNGMTDLENFGFLKTGLSGSQKTKFEEFAAKHSGN